MRVARRDALGRGSMVTPVMGIIVLLACYLLIAEWGDLPNILVSAVGAVHWPVSG